MEALQTPISTVEQDQLIGTFFYKVGNNKVWYWDLDNLDKHWFHKSILNQLGYENHIFSDEDLSRLIISEDLNDVAENFNKFRNKKNELFDQIIRYKHIDGNIMSFNFYGVWILDSEGSILRGLGSYELIDFQSNFDSNFDTTDIPIASSNSIWNSGISIVDRNLKYVYLDEDAIQALQREKKSVIGKSILSIQPMLKDSMFHKSLVQVIQTKQKQKLISDHTYNIRHETFLITMVPFDEGAIIINVNIPENLVKINKQLLESEQRWKFALDGAKDGLWDWNLKTNDVFFSTQWKAMLGFKENEIFGSLEEWSKRVHPEDLQGCYDDIQKHLDGEVDIYSNIHRVLCKDGRYKWILDRGKVVETDENGDAIRMVGIHTDLTERIEMEHELNLRNKELEQFTYITSHDLQEPLNSIISFSKLLENDLDNLGDIGKKSVEVITKSAMRMKEFIISLLEFSKIGNNKERSNTSIIELIEELKEDLHHLITQKEAEVLYKGDEIVCKVFKQDLIKLFQNLIINGIKYTEKDVKPVIIIEGKENLDHYIFSVKDNGIGIAEEHFDKIFEVFQRLHTRDQYSGTGIGLSYCKKVVDLHNGDIWLESKMGEGSTFYFKIPK